MNTLKKLEKSPVSKLQEIISRGGPEQQEYKQLEQSISLIADLVKDQQLTTDEMERLIKSCDFLFDSKSIMGHIRMKPHGYAGDYEIIERIYQNEILDERFRKWDCFSLGNPAAIAVRNRKRYFLQLLKQQMERKPDLNLCNIASGPGRDLLEVYENLTSEENTLTTTCVEMDANAIAYARKLTSSYRSCISFVKKNVFRFDTEERFDLIWSAGLFDYFDDHAFCILLKRFSTWLKPGGEIVIGNFNNAYNPSREFMELFGEWHLHHRSASDLINLGLAAGFNRDQLRIGKEPEHINLFLHIFS